MRIRIDMTGVDTSKKFYETYYKETANNDGMYNSTLTKSKRELTLAEYVEKFTPFSIDGNYIYGEEYSFKKCGDTNIDYIMLAMNRYSQSKYQYMKDDKWIDR